MEYIESLMFDFEDIEQRLKKAVAKLKEVLVDKSLPLYGRWGLFEKFSKYLETKTFVVNLNELEKFGWFTFYDTFSIEKYETVDLSDIIVMIQESIEYGDQQLKEVDIDALKEEILACGYGSFVYDW